MLDPRAPHFNHAMDRVGQPVSGVHGRERQSTRSGYGTIVSARPPDTERTCGPDDVKPAADLSGLHEPIREAISLALDRGIEHLDRVLVAFVSEQGAFRVQYEAGRLDLLANRARLNPMQRLGVARA